jgi:septum formation protein
MTASLILASGSAVRRELLQRLRLPFHWQATDTDETRLPGESPRALVVRLALAKARALAEQFPEALLIGADEVCAMGEQVYGKPMSVSAACEQLRCFSGQKVEFLSALAVVRAADGTCHEAMVPTTVLFRDLDAQTIARYVEQDAPLECAGSFRSEGLGPALCARMTSDDPTALPGLPLMALAAILRRFGVVIP